VAAPAPLDATVGKVGAAAMTATGVKRCAAVLSPNWPELPFPQQFTPPPVNTTQVWPRPAEIEDTPDNKLEDDTEPTANTCTGVDESEPELIPNWPELFSPQQFTPPPVNTTQLWLVPAEIEDTPDNKLEDDVEPTANTCFGVNKFPEDELIPNLPETLLPQQFTPPPVNTTQVCWPPAEIEDTPDNKLEDDVEPTANTCFGVNEFVVELIPNWPLVLIPQQFTPPPVNTTQVWVWPAEIEETPDNKLEDDVEPTANTCTGVDEFVFELIPNWPVLFLPQQFTPPPVNTTQVWA